MAMSVCKATDVLHVLFRVYVCRHTSVPPTDPVCLKINMVTWIWICPHVPYISNLSHSYPRHIHRLHSEPWNTKQPVASRYTLVKHPSVQICREWHKEDRRRFAQTNSFCQAKSQGQFYSMLLPSVFICTFSFLPSFWCTICQDFWSHTTPLCEEKMSVFTRHLNMRVFEWRSLQWMGLSYSQKQSK